jgi:uncharacterized protein
MVIAEAAYLVARELGGHAESAFYDAIIDGTLIVEPLTGQDWQRVRALVDRYADLSLGGTDASLIAMSWRRHRRRGTGGSPSTAA